MNVSLKLLSVTLIATLFLAGCGGSSSRSNSDGLTTSQVVGSTGDLVTANFTTALGINDLNQLVGVAEVTPGAPFSAVRWTVVDDATLTTTSLAPLLAGRFSAALAIDATGKAVGQADNGTRLVAVLWKSPEVATPLPGLFAIGNYAAYAISADGRLIVGTAVDGSSRTRAVLWAAEVNGDFLSPPTVLPVTLFANGATLSPFSSANGVVRVGANEILVVGAVEAGNAAHHAALWRSTDGGATFSAVDLGTGYAAYAVNGARKVVGENDNTLSPVFWQVSVSDLGVLTASAPVTLALDGSAVAVNEKGRVAGWSGTSDRATVWNGTTPAILYNPVSQAFALNNDLQPLVVGRNGNQGFVKRVN